MARPGTKIHEFIRPLSWLLGKWRGENGIGQYPTIRDFRYIEELEYFHVSKPAIQFAVVEIEEGTFNDTELKLVSNNVGSTTFVRDPIVTKVERHFKRVGDTLEIVISMETVNIPMTEHARNTLTKI